MEFADGNDLPAEVDAAMHAVFAEPLSRQEAAFEALLRNHPAHASALQARWNAVLAADAPPPVDGLERYRIEGKIGQGGMGEVLRAWDLLLERPVAIKFARSSGNPADPLLARFRNEAKLTARLDHPGVVPVHDLGTDRSGRAWFVMRLVSGASADAILARAADGPSQLARALDVLRRICATLAFAHSRGIVHRDLKPANVMVGEFGEVYVVDWGLAKRTASQPDEPTGAEPQAPTDVVTLVGAVIGTPNFMPPEQAGAGGNPADPRADVYAVGAMLYLALTGSAPYSEFRDADQILSALRRGPPRAVVSRAPRAPAALIAICERAMARERDLRYRDMSELLQDLDAFVQARAVKAYRTGPVVELRLWVKRNRALASAIAAIASVVLLSLVVVLFAWQAAEQSRHRFRSLSSVVQLERANREAADLHPPWPEKIPALRSWLTTFAIPLQEERASSSRELDRLRARGSSSGAATGNLHFADVDDAILYAGLSRHVSELALFLAEGGAVERVRADLRWAESITARSIEESRASWEAAIVVAREDARYHGLVLTPQIGLVPLGVDPTSGLLEFAELRSGTTPRRGPDGQLVCTDDSGVVFVLLPGGTARIGAQASDPKGPNHWLGAKADEAPVEDVTLAPFFLGKHEMTQAQWARLAGSNPSLAIGVGTGRRPVGFVTWRDAERVLREEGLVLPTEIQWEYACRAGASSAWATGDTVASLRGHANVADESALDRFGPGFRYEAGFIDGWIADAPVGSFCANAFGLHDLHGNHAEWCLDVYASPRRPAEPGSTGILGGTEVHRVHRGGSYAVVADNFARCAYRGKAPADTSLHDVGLRAARMLR